MHPALAHDLVEQRAQQRIADAEATRLGRRSRDRRSSRRVRPAKSEEPQLRAIVAVVPQVVAPVTC